MMAWVCIICGKELEKPGPHEGCPAAVGCFRYRRSKKSGLNGTLSAQPQERVNKTVGMPTCDGNGGPMAGGPPQE